MVKCGYRRLTMAQGLALVSKATFALSTVESVNQVKATYDYIGAGNIKLYCFPSNANCRVNLFINGVQILRNEQPGWFGTTGSMDTSSHLMTSVNTIGGRIECTFTSTTGTPTVDFALFHDGVPFGRSIAKLFGR